MKGTRTGTGGRVAAAAVVAAVLMLAATVKAVQTHDTFFELGREAARVVCEMNSGPALRPRREGEYGGAGGVRGRRVEVYPVFGCPSDLEQNVYDGNMVILVQDTKTKGCGLKEQFELIEKTKPELIVVLGEDNFSRPKPLKMNYILEGRAPRVPSCTMNKRGFDFFQENREGPIYFHNGHQVSLILQTVNVHKLTLFVDGERMFTDIIFGGEVNKKTVEIERTYQTIAIEVDRELDIEDGPPESEQDEISFRIIVEDWFGTNSEIWRCNSDTGGTGKEWKNGDFDASNWEKAVLTQKDLPDSEPVAKNWKEAGKWVGGKKNKFRCRASKFDGPVRLGNQELTLEKGKQSGFDEAERSCKARGPGAHLISIHSAEENAVVGSMIPSQTGVWIGMKARGHGVAWAWEDGTQNDYMSSILGHAQEDPLYPGGSICMVYAPNGTWHFEDCTKEYQFVCSRQLSGGVHELADESCFAYLTHPEDGEDPVKLLGEKPHLLSHSHGSSEMCVFGQVGRLSCCSSNYIHDIVSERLNAYSDLEDGDCKSVLEQAICFDCMANQGRYFDVNNGKMIIRLCSDLCEDIWSSCQGHSQVVLDSTGPKSTCEAVFSSNWTSVDGDVEIQMVDQDRQDCFRIDGDPPSVLKKYPASGSKIEPHFRERLEVVFDTTIRTSTNMYVAIQRVGRSEIFIDKDTFVDAPYSKQYVLDTSKAKFISLGQTHKVNDTLYIDLQVYDDQAGLNCIFGSGEFQIVLWENLIFDLAGNSYHGNEFADPWILFSEQDCYEADWTGVMYISISCAVTLVLFFGLYGRHQYLTRNQISRVEMETAHGSSSSSFHRLEGGEDGDSRHSSSSSFVATSTARNATSTENDQVEDEESYSFIENEASNYGEIPRDSNDASYEPPEFELQDIRREDDVALEQQ